MGALIFYTAIYFIGYYVAHLINEAARRMLIGNRRMAGVDGRGHSWLQDHQQRTAT